MVQRPADRPAAARAAHHASPADSHPATSACRSEHPTHDRDGAKPAHHRRPSGRCDTPPPPIGAVDAMSPDAAAMPRPENWPLPPADMTSRNHQMYGLRGRTERDRKHLKREPGRTQARLGQAIQRHSMLDDETVGVCGRQLPTKEPPVVSDSARAGAVSLCSAELADLSITWPRGSQSASTCHPAQHCGRGKPPSESPNVASWLLEPFLLLLVVLVLPGGVAIAGSGQAVATGLPTLAQRRRHRIRWDARAHRAAPAAICARKSRRANGQ